MSTNEHDLKIRIEFLLTVEKINIFLGILHKSISSSWKHWNSIKLNFRYSSYFSQNKIIFIKLRFYEFSISSFFFWQKSFSLCMSPFSMRCLTDSFRLTFNIFHRMLQHIKYNIHLWEVRIVLFKSIGSEFSGCEWNGVYKNRFLTFFNFQIISIEVEQRKNYAKQCDNLRHKLELWRK